MKNVNVVPIEMIEADLRLILKSPEMYCHDKTSLATLVSHLYSYIATYKLGLERPLSEWNWFVEKYSKGNGYFSDIPNILTMRNLLEEFLRQQYQRNGEIWISD